jgi:hypothetical protein
VSGVPAPQEVQTIPFHDTGLKTLPIHPLLTLVGLFCALQWATTSSHGHGHGLLEKCHPELGLVGAEGKSLCCKHLHVM